MKKTKEPPFQPFDTFEEFFAQAEQRPGYKKELLKLQASRARAMKRANNASKSVAAAAGVFSRKAAPCDSPG